MKFNTYPKYKESEIKWIGEIPIKWELHKLKRFSRIETGNTPSKEDEKYYEDGNFPWIRPDELIEFQPILDSKIKLNEDGKKLSRKIPRNSILVCCIGSLGKIGISGKELATNQQINSVIINENKCKFQFAKYIIFNSKSEMERIGNTNVVSIINKFQQGEISYCLPPLSQQTAIANFLDKNTAKIDALIEKDKKLIELLKEKRIALINHAVTKGLDPNVKMKDSGIDWIGEIPEDWEVKKLKFASDVFISNVDKKIHSDEDNILLCNYINVYNNEFITSNLEFMQSTASFEQIKKLSISKDDVIITKDSETIEEIAVPALVVDDLKNIVCGYHLSLIRSYKKELLGQYLFRLFQSKKFSEQFSIKSDGVTRFGISTYPIKNILILIPSKKEQNAIAEYLNKQTLKIDKTIQKIEQKIALLVEYKKSLIHHAVTGKIDVREAI